MKLSSRSDYATKAMLELSTTPDKPVNLAYLAQVEDISISYLEQIFSLLRKHNLVKSVRGPGGGYILSKPMSEITISDIVKAIDMDRKSKKIAQSEQHSDPSHQPASQQMWEQLSCMVYDYLSTISLEDIHNARNLQLEHEQASSGTQAA
ncbi:Iron-sulfur cluster regulator IscR [hydrothermal vent metagenome]|uniref:Iron-sulfur cluster regulator IscR n=1 Tax=hydrothermal vent metagenome TaxID=652676 RepID=A0A3B1B604_9ZZZZ